MRVTNDYVPTEDFTVYVARVRAYGGLIVSPYTDAIWVVGVMYEDEEEFPDDVVWLERGAYHSFKSLKDLKMYMSSGNYRNVTCYKATVPAGCQCWDGIVMRASSPLKLPGTASRMLRLDEEITCA
ncbi:MAG: hypothetical protein Q8M92_09425 [Candidatus Subteraquimicrobiales bacterium]|nr:hypothetical protein [Candidatus Subteraquimicrobiales bacterium]